jgi:hypothetical protein
MQDKGQAVARMGSDKDYFGISIDVRKSDVQKAIRLGNEKQALASFFAVFMMPSFFPRVEGEEETYKVASRCQGMVTNMINRLIVSALEDIGPANPALVRKVCITLMNMSEDPKLRDPQTLVRIITLMCRSKKSRVCSHLFHAHHPKNADKAAALEFDGANRELWQALATADELELKLKKQTHLQTMQLAVSMHNQRPHTEFLTYLMKFSKKTDPNHAMPAFSRYVIAFVTFYDSQTDQGEYFRKLDSEHVTLRNPLDNEESAEKYLNPTPDWLSPMEVSVDVHTKAGRKRGRNANEFRVSGAHVENECEVMMDKKAKELYLWLSGVEPNLPNKKENSSD